VNRAHAKYGICWVALEGAFAEGAFAVGFFAEGAFAEGAC
jgi:hypothetical protein